MQFGGQTPLSLAKPLQDALEKNPIVAASGASSSAWVACGVARALLQWNLVDKLRPMCSTTSR